MNTLSAGADVADIDKIEFHGCMKSREACMSKRTVEISKVLVFKSKTKTGRFGLGTTRDQNHGLKDNNTEVKLL